MQHDNYIAELDFGKPQIDDQAFVAPTAVVVGAVTMGPHSSIWYGAVARADARPDRDRRGLQRPGRLHPALRRRLPAARSARASPSATASSCTGRASTTTSSWAWAASS